MKDITKIETIPIYSNVYIYQVDDEVNILIQRDDNGYTVPMEIVTMFKIKNIDFNIHTGYMPDIKNKLLPYWPIYTKSIF